MKAPADVCLHLNDFEKWHRWSPGSHLDEEMTITSGDTRVGEGATSEWTGNEDVGQGRMVITKASRTSASIKTSQSEHPASDTRAPRCSWARRRRAQSDLVMEGTNVFRGKRFGMVMDMDAMVGADFEDGRNDLKGVVEPEAVRAQRQPCGPRVDEVVKNAADQHAAEDVDKAAAKALIENARPQGSSPNATRPGRGRSAAMIDLPTRHAR